MMWLVNEKLIHGFTWTELRDSGKSHERLTVNPQLLVTDLFLYGCVFFSALKTQIVLVFLVH